MHNDSLTQPKTALYQCAQIRLCEQKAIAEGITEDELMASAGAKAFSCLSQFFPEVKIITVFCGSGNNGGDGYVLARLAHEQGYSVTINQHKSIENLPSAARHAALQALAAGVSFQCLDEPIDSEVELIVDALLGIGLKGEVQAPLATAINQMNEARLPILSLDIPSGLDADTGASLGHCIRATVTVTFIGYKLGLMTLDGPDHCGEIICQDLNLSKILANINPAAYLLDKHIDYEILQPRLKNCHKGEFGHVLVIGGNYGMPGSVCLAAQAALRVGAGMVTIATRFEHVSGAIALIPEAMIFGVRNGSELDHLLAKATICVIGPGLGDDEWAKELFNKALTSQLPMIIDASALHLLAQNRQYDDNWILTPHPGEAASLLNCTTADIQQDRYQALIRLLDLYGGNVILKGAGSIIGTTEDKIYLCNAGNPGMASAGMGDTLNGVIAGLFAQGISLAEAAKWGVWLHAKAGDDAAEKMGEKGLVASDLLNYLYQRVNNRSPL